MAVLVQVPHAWKSSLCGKGRNDQRGGENQLRGFSILKSSSCLVCSLQVPEVLQKARRWKSVIFFFPAELEACQASRLHGAFCKEEGQSFTAVGRKGLFANYWTDGGLYSKVQETVHTEPSPCRGTCGWTSPAACDSCGVPLPRGAPRPGSAVCRCCKGSGLGALEECSLALDLNWERIPSLHMRRALHVTVMPLEVLSLESRAGRATHTYTAPSAAP